MIAQLPRIPPSHDMLARLLRDRGRPVPLHEVAALLGLPPAGVERYASVEQVLSPGNLVRWTAAARWLLDSWPLELLFEILGRDQALLPKGLQLLPVTWQLPAYVVHVLHIQAQIEELPHRLVGPAGFADYLWDVLHRAIDPGTVEHLRSDRDFMAAYEFPYGDADD